MTYIHRIVNAETGEVIEKDYTKKELDELKANQVRIDAEIAAAEAKEATRQAILNRLGLSEDEVKILLG